MFSHHSYYLSTYRTEKKFEEGLSENEKLVKFSVHHPSSPTLMYADGSSRHWPEWEVECAEKKHLIAEILVSILFEVFPHNPYPEPQVLHVNFSEIQYKLPKIGTFYDLF